MTANGASNRPSLTVVLPALNEEAHLAATLQSLRSQTEPAEQVLVVDGGSRDGTEAVAISFGATVLSAPGRGRGGQIAAGVAQVCEEVVLLAHADMLFPSNALEAVRDHLLKRPACPGGCLGHQFSSPKWLFRVIEWFDRWRARRGMSYGDQGQLRLLIELAEVHGQVVGMNYEIRFPLSHQELASLIGVTRETVTITLGQLEEAGLVRVQRRKVIIPSMRKLRAESQGQPAPAEVPPRQRRAGEN